MWQLVNLCYLLHIRFKKTAVPGYFDTGGRRLTRGVEEAGVHGRVAADPTIWDQKAK